MSPRVLLIVVTVAVPEIARAQPPARTFDELSRRLGGSDEVWITDAGGKETSV